MAQPLIVLGGADCVWRDFEAAQALIADFDVAAVNDAGKDYAGHLTLWATLHAEALGAWQRERQRKGLNTDYIACANKGHVEARIDLIRNELWPGSSGLYVCQVAAINFHYERIILCGIPMNPTPHYHDDKPWDVAARYRKGWIEAHQQPELAGRIRSMSGWTRELLFEPDQSWLSVTGQSLYQGGALQT